MHIANLVLSALCMSSVPTQVESFKFKEDQKRALVSRLLQRHCVTAALGIPWEKVRLRHDTVHHAGRTALYSCPYSWLLAMWRMSRVGSLLSNPLPCMQVVIKRTKGRKPFVVTRGLDKSAAPNFNFNVSHEVRWQCSPCMPLTEPVQAVHGTWIPSALA